MIYLFAAMLSPFAHAADACDAQALFSCQAEYTFVSGLIGPGPEDAAHFHTTNDARGNPFSMASSSIEVPGTGVLATAGVALLDGKRNFSLATEEGSNSRGTPFTQVDENTIRADITLTSQPDVVFGGKAEKLQTLSLTCRLTP